MRRSMASVARKNRILYAFVQLIFRRKLQSSEDVSAPLKNNNANASMKYLWHCRRRFCVAELNEPPKSPNDRHENFSNRIKTKIPNNPNVLWINLNKEFWQNFNKLKASAPRDVAWNNSRLIGTDSSRAISLHVYTANVKSIQEIQVQYQ